MSSLEVREPVIRLCLNLTRISNDETALYSASTKGLGAALDQLNDLESLLIIFAITELDLDCLGAKIKEPLCEDLSNLGLQLYIDVIDLLLTDKDETSTNSIATLVTKQPNCAGIHYLKLIHRHPISPECSQMWRSTDFDEWLEDLTRFNMWFSQAENIDSRLFPLLTLLTYKWANLSITLIIELATVDSDRSAHCAERVLENSVWKRKWAKCEIRNHIVSLKYVMALQKFLEEKQRESQAAFAAALEKKFNQKGVELIAESRESRGRIETIVTIFLGLATLLITGGVATASLNSAMWTRLLLTEIGVLGIFSLLALVIIPMLRDPQTKGRWWMSLLLSVSCFGCILMGLYMSPQEIEDRPVMEIHEEVAENPYHLE